MVHAFVFGKFLPFHRGHEAMIRFARAHCDRLSVLVCASDREPIPGEVRHQWLAATFPPDSGINIQVFNYRESDFPNTSVSSREVSAIWSALFRQLFPDVQLLVTSEPYGDYVAGYMGIRHLAFDPGRQQVPVSATEIRRNISDYWSFLPDAVKPYFAQKVAILGTESTGKSTLAQYLAQTHHCTLVTEAGRDIVSNSKHITLEQLYEIAREHARRIEQAQRGPHALVILDTDIHITQSYARYFFGQYLSVSPEIVAANRAHQYLYLTKDAPYHQDGTRLDETVRNALDLSHRKTLEEHGILYVEIAGNWLERQRAASAIVAQSKDG